MSSSNLTETDRTPARYAPGDVVRDRYEVVELLGAGANGAVYRVDDQYSGTEVALKILSPEHSVEAARRELSAAKAVSHDNIAKVIDIDRLSTEPRCWLLTQEFVEGTSLDAYGCDGDHRLDVSDALDAIDQLLQALEAIHPDFDRIEELEQRENSQGELEVAEFYELQDLKASGFVHRDIKPQNIRRRLDGVIKLIDFGIASEVNSTIHTRSATPEYAPPDADLFRWKPAYDLFATGVIAFELLTHESPFIDRLPALGRSTTGVSLRDGQTGRVLEVIERAISEDPSQRFDSASEMRRFLAATAESAASERPAASAGTDSPLETASTTGSAVAAAARAAEMSLQYERALEIADHHGLGAREYERSLMLTPGRNQSRYLVNLAFHPDRCGVGISPENWSAFYDIDRDAAVEALGGMVTGNLSERQLTELLTQLDLVLTNLDQRETSITSASTVLVDFLEANHPHEFSVSALVQATGLPRGTVRRRLSDLVNGHCAKKLHGRVETVRRGHYTATRQPGW
ncbi:MAG: protein kinase [Microthrixaceae bacterium]